MVPALTTLLDVQELDLKCDRLGQRKGSLTERDALQQADARRGPLDEAHAALVERREALSRSERELGREVAAVSAKAKEAEETLYSGTVKAPKELEALQEEIRLLRDRQSGLEDRELELLEEIEETESDVSGNRAARNDAEAEARDLESAIREMEAEIDAELADLAEQRGGKTKEVPSAILAEYDRLRTKERLAGRAAAPLNAGSCGGCRLKLPVLDYNRMKAEPEDALLYCVHCKRLLVR